MVMSTLNGAHPSTSHAHTNGHDGMDVEKEETAGFSMRELEAELISVEEGVVPLGVLVHRLVQACYMDLQDLHETMPTASDHNRKTKLANFAVTWKRHVAKVYAVAKWSRDAEVIRKCMSIIAFLGEHNLHFVEALETLANIKNNIEPIRARNHDLLTSLDVLTTGTYRRLPSRVAKTFVPQDPLTDAQVARTLARIEAAIRYRLRMSEIVPVEMSAYRIHDGRAFFTVPGLFETSICLLGQEKTDMWFFSDVEFLFTVGGEVASIEDFPTKPTGTMLQHIADEADRRMGLYRIPPPPANPLDPEPPAGPQLPEGAVDAPLVRLFNFLQMMSLSYQLEVLFLQAQRLRSLGWAEYLRVQMSADRHTLTLSYWIRKPLPPNRPTPRFVPPPLGGTVTISLATAAQSTRKPKARVLAELQARSKLDKGARPSDEVESARWEIRWEPQRGALGVQLAPEDAALAEGELRVDPSDLDVEKILRAAIHKHTRGIWNVYIRQLKRGSVFSAPDAVVLVPEPDGTTALRVFLCADEMVFARVDARTGLVDLRDTGDLGAAGRAPRFASITDKLNENPAFLLEALVRLRLNTIVDIAEQKANYLGLQTYRMRNLSDHDMLKFGASARASLYIQLAPYPTNYLVLVVADDDFRYALISTSALHGGMYAGLALNDIGWLDISRICARPPGEEAAAALGKRKREEAGRAGGDSRFKLETSVLRELYAYCCARVSHTKVEKQFKDRGIPYTHVFPSSSLSAALPAAPGATFAHSSLSKSIPALCVQSADVIATSQAYEAAMPNIRVIPLAWWSASAARAEERPPQVVTCVKLKYVQQPVGRRAGADTGKGVIRPSRRIVYDAQEAVVCFLADQVEGCVDMFMKEWESVSKIVVIAREVAQMAKQWKDVRLLSFDLQTVEFAYASDYVVSVTGDDPAVTRDDPADLGGGSFSLHFSRLAPSTPPATASTSATNISSSRRTYNPHADAEPFFMTLLRTGRIAASLPALVAILRNTVPIIEVLEGVRAAADSAMDLGGPSEGAEKEEWSWADVDTFPKAAGWWRAAFGPRARHALDLRLMQGARIAVVDAAYVPKARAPAASAPGAGDDALLFRPIPRFAQIVAAAVRGLRPLRRDSIAVTEVGVVCDVAEAAAVARRVWEGVLREFGVVDGAA